jgi:hypothetical protein
MASSLPSIEGLANGAKFNLCVGLQAGTLGASFAEALGIPGPDVASAYPSLFEWACDIPPSQAPAPPAPPFIGGQCPVVYNVTINYSYLNLFNNNPVNQNATVNGVGPIQSIILQATNAPGSNFLIRVIFSDGTDTIQNFTVGPSGFANAQANIVSIVRADGQPDNCGNPPGPPIPPFPPGGAPVTGPISYRDEGDNIINVDGDFVFQAPSININGQVEVDFTVNIPIDNRSYRGTLNLSTGDFNVTPTFVLPGRPKLETDGPSAEPQPPNSDEPETDDLNDELIVAMIVTSDITNNNQATERFYSQQPTTTVPRIGVARFAIPVPGSSQAVWTADIPIKQTRQWIDCPCPYGAVDAIASPEPGSGNVILQVQLIRGRPPAAI